MSTVAGLGVIEVSSGVVQQFMVKCTHSAPLQRFLNSPGGTDCLSLDLASASAEVVMVVSERHKKHGHIHFMLA